MFGYGAAVNKNTGHVEFCIGDPLAQTFIVEEIGGCFITKLDLFFSAKDNVLPVWVEVRSVLNGYPSKKLLPFGRKVLEPSDINVDADTGTKFCNNFYI